MRTVELKLAHWRRLYGELSEAQSRLRDIKARQSAEKTAAELEAEVQRLQQESNSAMDAVHAALANKSRAAGQPTSSAASK